MCMCDDEVCLKVYDEEALFQFQLADFDHSVMSVVFAPMVHFQQKTFLLNVHNYCLTNVRYYVLLQRLHWIDRKRVEFDCIFLNFFLREHVPFSCNIEISPKITVSGVLEPQIHFPF